ncbi:nicotinate-nucleotide diphosphorylase (carboxylating) [Sulfurihydrogenibium azorense Az-Fu1]|uniref:Probable nicotinate-nucleotide pyrophosphorylase [carboxylating] n=1 Tax=Sulfurihydrogenibium azorense (strain DSM 15241 / OCM 825 / Az-Fu1) TaxID=204536 RepID=C1DT30_SULAA|nr:carboxylating nicotinate-nucleotide diphosphorylase [Sulfurihydrogenibium azorense]ACN99375.1 nicotinate-nucleotide diphosphorylase (carboxylating) [Sulfurihydrogenibium azorense Az-Fu1]
MLDRVFVRRKILEFLEEDIGYRDLTTDSLDVDKNVEGFFIAKQSGVVAGTVFVKEVFNVFGDVSFQSFKKEGDYIEKGEIIGLVYGNCKSILKGERVALNILQRLSGIATLTNLFIKELEGTKTKLLDTRKTTPGFRAFEKYAVKVGGGENHRFALYDMVMLKDNHIALVGSIKEAVKQVKSKVSPIVKVEVEVSNFDQLYEALETEADIIMLDNMTPTQVKEAVEIINGKKLVEVSGNITLENIKQYALSNPDFVSTGSVIHSAKWLDISLKLNTGGV